MGTAAIATSAGMAALGIRHGDSSGRIRVSGFQVQFQPGKGFGEGTGCLLRFRAAVAPTFVPILTTLGAQAQTLLPANCMHGDLKLELLPHQKLFIQQGFREKNDIEILAPEGMGASGHQLWILAAKKVAAHMDRLLEGLEAAGTDPFPDGLALHFQIEIRVGGQDPKRPASLPQSLASLQGEQRSRALQTEAFGRETGEFDHLVPSAGGP
jgi:hypothetical protein